MGHGQQNDVFSWANSLSCISHPYARRLNSEDTVEGGEVAMDRLRLVEEAGATQDVAERNMTAEWAALTTGSAISKTIQVGVPTLAPQMSHHGSHSNDNGVFCNDHYRQRTKHQKNTLAIQ